MSNFATVVVCDFEYEVADGELPDVLCMVAHVLDENLRHVRTIKLWRDEFGAEPPFDIGPDALFVAYSAWAEMTCFKVLGWRFPVHIFDQSLPTWRLAIFCCHTIPTKFARNRASACPTRAEPTASKDGSASIRTRSPSRSATVLGASAIAPRIWSTTVRKTCGCLRCYCARSSSAAANNSGRRTFLEFCIGQITAPNASP